jgi:MarR family transcriptional regulator, organic hydroperoxide resistance regulator
MIITKDLYMDDMWPISDKEQAEIANKLFFKIYQCSNQMHKTGTKALSDYHVTTQQWAVLGALSRMNIHNGMQVNELSDFLMVSRQSLTGVLARLTENGYIIRVEDENDRRSKRITLTQAGRKLWEDQLIPRITEYYKDSLDSISTEEQLVVLKFLNKLLSNFSKL